MSISDILIQISASLVGTLSFGILFNVRGHKLLWTTIGGTFSWGLFLLLGNWIASESIRYLLVSICSTTYSEILARKLKTPASTFCINTLIPLVPGGALYYTTTSALSGNLMTFLDKLTYTLELSVSLSLGIVLVTAISRYVPHLWKINTLINKKEHP